VTTQVETQSGDVSRIITGEQADNIALNGRNYAQLLQLLPGAVATSTNPFGIGLSTTGQAIHGARRPRPISWSMAPNSGRPRLDG
jgi:hypothetical protein